MTGDFPGAGKRVRAMCVPPQVSTLAGAGKRQGYPLDGYSLGQGSELVRTPVEGVHGMDTPRFASPNIGPANDSGVHAAVYPSGAARTGVLQGPQSVGDLHDHDDRAAHHFATRRTEDPAATGAPLPPRLRLSRRAGFRLRDLHPTYVNVGRPARSPFANPHGVGNDGGRECGGQVHNRAEAVALYREILCSQPGLVERARRELVGKPLACWCKLPEPGQPDVCHAALLIRVVAGEEP